MKPIVLSFLLVLLTLGLTACGDEEEAAKPLAQKLTGDHIGYYCSMVVAEHRGPKGQIHLKDQEQAIWFSSVRDAIAFTMLPEEPKNIAAIYVNDMTTGDWSSSEPGNWIEAESAFYVLGSNQVGGMGAAEAIPFSREDAAQRFADKHGGHVVAFGAIPEDYILGGVETPQQSALNMASDTDQMASDDASHDMGHNAEHEH
jgi:copper chaperone NosL